MMVIGGSQSGKTVNFITTGVDGELTFGRGELLIHVLVGNYGSSWSIILTHE